MYLLDFKDRDGSWVRSLSLRGRQVYTISGRKFSSLIDRCTPGSFEQRKHPAYEGCTNDFESFNEFSEWHQMQVGYGEFQIDKDLLVLGNKSYSVRTCILLPKVINQTLIGKSKDRGLPTGVYRYKGSRYIAILRIPSSRKSGHIGMYDTPEEAHEAYKVRKSEVLKALAKEYKDRLDPVAYEALMNR